MNEQETHLYLLMASAFAEGFHAAKGLLRNGAELTDSNCHYLCSVYMGRVFEKYKELFEEKQ